MLHFLSPLTCKKKKEGKKEKWSPVEKPDHRPFRGFWPHPNSEVTSMDRCLLMARGEGGKKEPNAATLPITTCEDQKFIYQPLNCTGNCTEIGAYYPPGIVGFTTNLAPGETGSYLFLPDAHHSA